MDNLPKKIGLIAGSDKFPFLILRAARDKGLETYVAAIKGVADPALEDISSHFRQFRLGHIQKLMDWMNENEVRDLIMAGQVKQVSVFNLAHLDKRAVKLIAKVPTKQTASLLGAVTEEFEKEGFNILDSHILLKHMMPKPGCLTKKELTGPEKEDVDYGYEIAKEIGRLDIGQTIVLKDKTILAIEAIEGTNAAIERAAAYGGKGIIVVKVSRPGHDMRFDIPVVGLDTIELLIKVKARAIAIEAGKTLFFDREESLKLAEKAGITIVAC